MQKWGKETIRMTCSGMESCDCRLSEWTGKIPETGGERDRETDKMFKFESHLPLSRVCTMTTTAALH